MINISDRMTVFSVCNYRYWLTSIKFRSLRNNKKKVTSTDTNTTWLTFLYPPPRSSGCAEAPPTAGLPRCRRWKRQRSRGGGRFPTWAACPTAESPGSAYLSVGRRDGIHRICTRSDQCSPPGFYLILKQQFISAHFGYRATGHPPLIQWAWNPQQPASSQYKYKNTGSDSLTVFSPWGPEFQLSFGWFI